MADQSHNPQAAAEESAAAEVPRSAEEAQAAAPDGAEAQAPAAAGDTAPTHGEAPEAVPGEDVDSAEEAQAAEPEPDYRDLYLRASAEMDNVRKRARRDVGAAETRGVAKLAKELLPALDNLERALQAAAAPTQGTGEAAVEQTEFSKGVRLVQGEFAAALTRVGITTEDPKGQPFDPHRHEALAQTPIDGVEAGIVVEVYQPGYLLGETVLRAARVVVAG